MRDEYFEYQLEIRRTQARTHSHGRASWHEDGFRCIYCQAFVSIEPIMAGVNNRNHCPYCLWSRHLDLYKPGDRLCACKARMKPIGLTLKKRLQKYGSKPAGELMVIHQCMDCGKLSINRLAADDNTECILEIFKNSQKPTASLNLLLETTGVILLDAADTEIVYRRLLGTVPFGFSAHS